MPKLEHAPDLSQKQQVLRQAGLPGGQGKRLFQVRVVHHMRRGAPPEAPGSVDAPQIEPDDHCEGPKHRHMPHIFPRGQLHERSQLLPGQYLTGLDQFRQGGSGAFRFFEGHLDFAEPARNHGVQIASHQAADDHGDHAPIGQTRHSAKLERRMERDQRRRHQPHEDVIVEPVFGLAFSGKPFPALPNRVNRDQQQ